MVEKKKKTRSTSSSVDPATQYARDVDSGKEIAGPDIRNSCKRHLRDLESCHARGLIWDVAAAQRAIDFFAFAPCSGRHPFTLSTSIGPLRSFLRSAVSDQLAFSLAVSSNREISRFSFSFSACSKASCRCLFSIQVEKFPLQT